MVLFAILHTYAFGYRKYRDLGVTLGEVGDKKGKYVKTPICKGITDAFNPRDTLYEIKFACKYIWHLITGKELPDSTSRVLSIYDAIHFYDQRTYNPLYPLIINYEKKDKGKKKDKAEDDENERKELLTKEV